MGLRRFWLGRTLARWPWAMLLAAAGCICVPPQGDRLRSLWTVKDGVAFAIQLSDRTLSLSSCIEVTVVARNVSNGPVAVPNSLTSYGPLVRVLIVRPDGSLAPLKTSEVYYRGPRASDFMVLRPGEEHSAKATLTLGLNDPSRWDYAEAPYFPGDRAMSGRFFVSMPYGTYFLQKGRYIVTYAYDAKFSSQECVQIEQALGVPLCRGNLKKDGIPIAVAE